MSLPCLTGTSDGTDRLFVSYNYWPAHHKHKDWMIWGQTEWLSGLLNEWMNEWMDDWITEWIDKSVNE